MRTRSAVAARVRGRQEEEITEVPARMGDVLNKRGGRRRQDRKECVWRGWITGNFPLEIPRHRRNSNAEKDAMISAIGT